MADPEQCENVKQIKVKREVEIGAESSKSKRFCGEDVTHPQFPVEIWAKVFENLNCVALCQVRRTSSAWKNIVEGFFMGKFILKIPNKLVRKKLRTFPKLPASTMIFKDCRVFSVGSWWSKPFTKRLVNLELYKCKITLINLLRMLRYTPYLASLKYCGSTVIYEKAVEGFSDQRLEKLENLTLCNVEQDTLLEWFSRMFPRLKDFTLLSDYHKCHRGVMQMIESLPLEGISLISPSDNLSQLAGVSHRFKRVSITVKTNADGRLTEHLINFSQKQPLLECFELRIHNIDNHNISTASLTTIFQNLPRLKRLSMDIRHARGTRGITPIDMQSIGCLTDLEYFSFCGKHLAYNGAKNPNLKELFLRCTIRSSDLLHKYIASAPNLRVLTLNCNVVKDWAYLLLAIKSSGLRCLKLDTVKVVHYSLARMGDKCFDMRCLELKQIFKMKEEYLTPLLGMCPRLEELHLEGMENVGDTVVLWLCQNMKQLRKLTIRGCSITDSSASLITENTAWNLEQLTIEDCNNLTTAGVARLRRANIGRVEVKT